MELTKTLGVSPYRAAEVDVACAGCTRPDKLW